MIKVKYYLAVDMVDCRAVAACIAKQGANETASSVFLLLPQSVDRNLIIDVFYLFGLKMNENKQWLD